jgi:hypothetical protein
MRSAIAVADGFDVRPASLSEQEDACRAELLRRGLDPAGVAAATITPVADCRGRGILDVDTIPLDVLAVTCLERLGDESAVAAALSNSDLRVISVAERLDTDTPEGCAAATMLGRYLSGQMYMRVRSLVAMGALPEGEPTQAAELNLVA